MRKASVATSLGAVLLASGLPAAASPWVERERTVVVEAVSLIPWPTVVPNDPYFIPRSVSTGQPLTVFYNQPASALGYPLPGIALLRLPRHVRASPWRGAYPD